MPDALDYSTRKQLAENVRRLMDEHAELSSVPKLAKHARWPAGKKRGELISERNLRYALKVPSDPSDITPSPGLDVIIGIANAFEVPAWQLLADSQVLRIWRLAQLMATGEHALEADSDGQHPTP